jgi:hypothetical protein
VAVVVDVKAKAMFAPPARAARAAAALAVLVRTPELLVQACPARLTRAAAAAAVIVQIPETPS